MEHKLQKYLDARNELYSHYCEARNAFSANSTRKSTLKSRNPQHFAILKARYEGLYEQLEAMERTIQCIASEFDIRICGMCSPRAFIGKPRTKRAEEPTTVPANA